MEGTGNLKRTFICFNSFNAEKHERCPKSLRKVLLWMLAMFTHLNGNEKICGNCRIKLSSVRNSNDVEMEEITASSEGKVVCIGSVRSFNESLVTLGVSPSGQEN